jgi:hypothetical protein
MRRSLPYALGVAMWLTGCKDIDRFTTEPGQSYCGKIVSALMVRQGFEDSVCMRMTFDAHHVNDRPGLLWTTDGLFNGTPMRAIPQLSNDPLLMFTFGEGREKNFLFMADPVQSERGPAVNVVVSLMHSGEAEVRLIRGATEGPEPPSGLDGASLFGVFTPLQREEGACRAEPGCTWMPE